MLEFIKNNKLIFYTVWFFRRLAGITPEKKNFLFHQKRSSQLINHYLQKHGIKKLQIGSQSNSIGDWLNVDIEPKDIQTAYMDATQTFPFADNIFDFIFTEHMIEHISFHQGEFMLQECFRVLKKGGKIRISTPDLQFLMDLYQEPKTETQQKYIRFSQKYFKNPIPELDTIVINNFFRDWGHQFIHDRKSLSFLLQNSGFQNIRFCEINQSNELQLQNLEQHGKEISEEFNQLESLIVEADKP